MPPRRTSTRRSAASAARSRSGPSAPTPAPATRARSVLAVDAERFDLLAQQVRDLTEAVQAVQATHSRGPAPTRPARGSPEPGNPVQERPMWATQPPALGREGQPAKSPCSDRGSTQGEALHLFREKTLGIKDREDFLDQRLMEMGRRIEELRHTPSSRGNDICTDPPFSQKIMQEQVPPNFKLPHFESYDGTTDPIDHLEAFRTTMLLHGAPDAILCRAFPSTLKGAARN